VAIYKHNPSKKNNLDSNQQQRDHRALQKELRIIVIEGDEREKIIQKFDK